MAHLFVLPGTLSEANHTGLLEARPTSGGQTSPSNYSTELQAHSVETGIATITDGGVTLKINTKHLTNLGLRIDSIYQFIGELQIQSENDAILQARVGRNVDGIDLNLYYQTMKLRRKFEEEIVKSRTK